MLPELILETHKKSYLDYFSQDEKSFRISRILYAFIFMMVFAMFVYIMKNNLLFVASPVVILMGYKLPYFRLILQKKQRDLIVSFLFPEFLDSFAAVLTTSGNVYQALNGTLEYLKEPLKKEIETLIEKIEQGNDRQHYLDVADYVGTSEAYMIMGRIYQFSEYGIQLGALEELQDYIQNLNENKVNDLLEKKLGSMEIHGLTPVLISLFFLLGFAGVLVYYYFIDVFTSLEIIGVM